MKIVISKSILGSERHLLHEKDLDQFLWVDEIPDGAWVYKDEGQLRDLGVLLQARGIEIDSIFDKSQEQVWKELRPSGVVGVPAHHALGTRTFKKRLSSLLDQLWMFLNENIDGYYMNEFVIGRDLLMKLQRPKVNRLKYSEEIKKSSISSQQNIEKFEPDRDGFCDSPKYSQIGSVTGRITATGPNILTLKRQHRRMFSSRFQHGQLLQVDLVSLEPRVTLSVAGKASPPDIYSHISEHIFNGDVSREDAKIITLSCLYGASPHSVAKRLGDISRAKSCIRKIENFFEIPSLSQVIEDEISKLGCFHNLYGRVLKDSSSRINHFIQSSSVDVSLMCFSKLLRDCERMDLDVIPIFVIHDALVVDINQVSLNGFRKIVDLGLRAPKLNFPFPAKIKNLYI